MKDYINMMAIFLNFFTFGARTFAATFVFLNGAKSQRNISGPLPTTVTIFDVTKLNICQLHVKI